MYNLTEIKNKIKCTRETKPLPIASDKYGEVIGKTEKLHVMGIFIIDLLFILAVVKTFENYTVCA